MKHEKKRTSAARRKVYSLINPVIAVAIAFIVSGLVVTISGGNPLEAYAALAKGAFGSLNSIKTTVRYMLPILLLAMSFAFCNRCGYFNIGQEGQMYAAVLTICWLQLVCAGLPQWLTAILMILGASVAAGVMSLIPALLKFILGINEVVVAILLNYIILQLSEYLLLYTPIASSGTSIPMSLNIEPTLSKPLMVVAVVCIVIAYMLIMRNTVPGFRVRMVGYNPTFAKANGIQTIRVVLVVSLLGGALAGLAAAGETMGIYHKMYRAYADGMGFSGMTAALIGKQNPLGMVLGSLLLGALQSGAVNLSVMTDVPAEMVLVVKGFVMLFATINLLQFLLVRNRHHEV